MMIVSRKMHLLLPALVTIATVVSAFVPLPQHRPTFTTLSRIFMTPPESEMGPRHTEFINLEPLSDSSERRQRKERDSRLEERFAAYGDELWKLRTDMERLSDELMNSKGTPERAIRDSLYELEQKDPEIVYKVELDYMTQAEQDGRLEDAERHRETAMAARSCLPQFNLEGLWVGKYGNHGYEMINVTYVGDIMVAYKVTGDKNVPRGEITFQADLSPMTRSVQNDNALQPITLTEKAAKKWGTKQLPRFNGLGQVAEEGFVNNQWMEGQLILIGREYFSFAWVPIEHQIFFGRPSPELALKMLRESGDVSLQSNSWSDSPPTMDAELDVLKQYAKHCLEVTAETIDEELQGDEFGCIWHGMDTEECYFE